MSEQFLPYGCQSINQADIEAVVSALGSELLTGGLLVAKFEKDLARYCGSLHAIACSSGTAALHLAAMALDLSERDAVIVPAITFVATANCARLVGAEVIFADVDPGTGLITTGTLEAALADARKRSFTVKAVIPVHYGGQFADVVVASRANGLTVVEDAAHAIGTAYSCAWGSGSVGDCRGSLMTTLSFHPVKTITTGEGGAILTNNEDLAHRLARIRSHGINKGPNGFLNTEQAFGSENSRNPWYQEMGEPGMNYRLTDFQAALGSSQLSRIETFIERRRHIAALYDALFAPLAPLAVPLRRLPESCRTAWHLYGLKIDFAGAGIERAALMRRLSSEGIGTQVHYMPVYRHPYYERRYGKCRLPGAEDFYRGILSIPLHPGMTDDQVRRVAQNVSKILSASKS